MNGINAGETSLMISAHGQNIEIEVTVEKYGNITGSIQIVDQSESYQVHDQITIEAEFFSNNISINDANKIVSFRVFYPDGTEHPTEPQDVSLSGGKATTSFTFPYAGNYTIYCALEEDGKYAERCETSITVANVVPLESQKIESIDQPEEPIGTYGDNEGDTTKIEFTATVADVNSTDLRKGWTVTSDAIEGYTVTINPDSIKKNENGLFNVSGYINLKPSKAGNNLNLTLTYSHTDDKNQQVYGDATNSTTFSINQKPLHVTDITFENKIYDGTTNVGIQSVTFDEEDIVEGDKSEIVADINGQTFQLATATRDDKDNVKEGISYLPWQDEIQWDEEQTGTISLVNDAMNDNYLIVKGEEIGEKGFTCEIKRRPIYLEVSDGTREYGTDLPEDQKNVELKAYDKDDKSGIVDGDKVEDNITVIDTKPEALVQEAAYAYALKPSILDENSGKRSDY